MTRRGRPLPVVGLITMVLGALTLAPLLLDTYALNILFRAFLYAAVALSVDVLWGYAGILTFGQSAFFGIGAYGAGLVFTHLGFGPEWAILALAAALLVSVILAGLVGWLAFGQGVSPLYISVVTLVLPIVVTQLVLSGGTFTGSSSGLSGFPTFDLPVERWFWIAGMFLVTVTVGAWIFVRSDAGRLLIAIRENEQRCQYLGINTVRVKILLLMAASVVAALAGYANAGYQDVIAPEMTGFVFGTQLVIWVALGGRGTLLGPVIGTILIDYTSAYLSGNYPFIWQLFIGIAFVLVIIALPRGLLPVLGDWLRLKAPSPPALRPSPERVAEMQGPALRIEGVARHYGSLRVLEGIDLEAKQGELLSLIGPNGAGKTTLMRCISDGKERSAGKVLINGHDIHRLTPDHCVGFGIGRKFQTATVFETLTVAQCLRVARARVEPLSLWRRAELLTLPPAALRVITATGLDSELGRQVKHLSHGLKQGLELAMVLAQEPSVLLLDEPTAGLTKPERRMIGEILVDLARHHGFLILLVEHDLDFVREISSRVVVLHQGRIVLDGTVAEIVSSALVRTIYAGEAHAL